MESNSKDFRNTHKVKIQGINGEDFEVMIDDILSKYNELYTTKKEENNEKINLEDSKYLQAIEIMLGMLPRNKILEFVRKDYENKKISDELFDKVQRILETRTVEKSKEESTKTNEVIRGKHPITLLDDDELEK